MQRMSNVLSYALSLFMDNKCVYAYVRSISVKVQ